MSKKPKSQLYGFGFNVRPLPLHPDFWEMESAVLWVFIVGEPGLNAKNYVNSEAGKQACKAVPTHLYEFVDKVVGWDVYPEGKQTGYPQADYAIRNARANGLAMMLNYTEVGEDTNLQKPDKK